MASGPQGRAIGARTTPNIEHRRAGPQILLNQEQHFGAGLFHRRTGAVNVFAMQDLVLPRMHNVAVWSLLETGGSELQRDLGNLVLSRVAPPRRRDHQFGHALRLRGVAYAANESEARWQPQ